MLNFSQSMGVVPYADTPSRRRRVSCSEEDSLAPSPSPSPTPDPDASFAGFLTRQTMELNVFEFDHSSG